MDYKIFYTDQKEELEHFKKSHQGWRVVFITEGSFPIHLVYRNKQSVPTWWKKFVKYNDEQLKTLRICYESPTNEFKHLSFEDYIKNAEEAEVIDDLLAEWR